MNANKSLLCLLLIALLAASACTEVNKDSPLELVDGSKVAYSLYVDAKGNVWYPQEYEGIAKLSSNLKIKNVLKSPLSNKIGLINNNRIFAFQLPLLAVSDDGLTWKCYSSSIYQNCNETIQTPFNGIRAMASNSNYLFLGTYQGIYRSENGITWQPVYFDEQSSGRKAIYDMAQFDNKLFASANTFLEGAGVTNSDRTGIIESDDNGITWSNSLVNDSIFYFAGSDSNFLYAYDYTGSWFWKKSMDSKWQMVSYLPVKKVQGNEMCNFKFTVPDNGEIWGVCSLSTSEYKGGDFPTIDYKGVYLLNSRDQGMSWSLLDLNNDIKVVYDIKYLDSGYLLLATNLGIFKKSLVTPRDIK